MSLLTITEKDKLDLITMMTLHKMPDYTENQTEMMLHAIGADYKSARSYLGRQTYHAFRNHYDAGGADIEQWNDLVKKGYATKNTFYHVSPRGFDLLELLTGRSTIYDAYGCYADCRTAILTKYLKADVYCGHGCWLPTPATYVSKALHIPITLVREACRNLVEEGYLVKGYYGEMDEDGCVHCLHGYYITEKARQLERWQALYDEEVAYINKTLGVERGCAGEH